ncbi:MAG TPA: hypothetical protein DD618_03595 [Acholeplasmatales bacterium]|nr:hypothetical protein [Acholeplasmatales bacterium]
MICLTCLHENDSLAKTCAVCGSDFLIEETKNFIMRGGRKIPKSQWTEKMCAYRDIRKPGPILKGETKPINLLYLQGMLLKNIRKQTILRLILPAVCFFGVSAVFCLGALLVRNQPNLISVGSSENVVIFSFFASGLTFLFSLGFLTMILLKMKVYVSSYRGKRRYRRLSAKAYQEMTEALMDKGGKN